jgi:hypothetical protein
MIPKIGRRRLIDESCPSCLAKAYWPSPPLSTSRSTRAAVRSQPKPWPHATACRHDISSPRHGILKGIRGPRGGYELAREQHRITADDILRAAGTADDIDGVRIVESGLLTKVVIPALGQAEHAFSSALARINVEDLAHSAEGLRKSAGQNRADCVS